jgi:hypothetical protein
MSEVMIFASIVFIGVSAITLLTYIDGLRFKVHSAQTDAAYWKKRARLLATGDRDVI